MDSKIVRVIGAAGALFNLAGVQAYLAHVGVLGAEAVPEGSQIMPVWVTAAFAVAVFSGVLGSIGLALLKSWARPVLWLCLVASVVNWGWVFANSDQASVPLGATVIAISLLLALVAQRAFKSS